MIERDFIVSTRCASFYLTGYISSILPKATGIVIASLVEMPILDLVLLGACKSSFSTLETTIEVRYMRSYCPHYADYIFKST